MKMGANEKGTDYSTSPKEITVEGFYHCQILSTRPIQTKKGGTSDFISLEVLAGTEPNQENRRARCYLNRKNGVGEEQWTEGHTRWAWASGLLVPGGPEIIFDPQHLEGREVVVHVTVDENSHRANVANFGDDVWPVNDPEVSKVPKAKPRDCYGEVKPSNNDDLSDLFG